MSGRGSRSILLLSEIFTLLRKGCDHEASETLAGHNRLTLYCSIYVFDRLGAFSPGIGEL